MPLIPCSAKTNDKRRAPSVWRSAAAIAAATVVMTVLATTASAVTQTYPGTAQQREHTRMFLLEFPDELRALRGRWGSGDFCTWPGVVCYENATVDVELANMNLVGSMPEVDSDIDGSLVTVRSVDLSGNPGIDDDFEDDWKRMTLLERLDVSGTSLKGTLPREWEGMRSLRYLNISGTSACRSLPRWRGMSQLSVVDFSHCNLRGTVPSDFGALSSSVTEAHFEGNNLCGCLPSTFARDSALYEALTSAQPEIGASNCAVINQCADDADKCNEVVSPERNTLLFLREFADEFDDQLEHLWRGENYCTWSGVTCNETDGTVSVDLSGRGLDGDLPEIDDDIDASKVLVTSIDLSNNPRLDDDFEEDWGRLKRLRYLNLSNTALDGSLPYEWNSMVSLEVLDLHNTIACRSLPEWQLPNLRVVDLSGSSFHGSLTASWAAMTALESVNLTGNGFCGCVPSAWRDHDALSNAVAELGSGGVSADDCALTNACTFAMSRCRNPNAGNGGAGTGGTGSGDATLDFLREFPDKLPGLRGSWTGSEYCSWSGVTCNANGTVSVDLSGRGLYGNMPELDDDINGGNVNVVSIDLSNNPNIRGNFRSDWAGLRQLEYLDLSDTSLYGNIPDSWNGMAALREVRIRNTAACRGLPNWNARAMPNLRVVDFRNNNMGGSLAYSWALFAGQLESVDFSGNDFCGCVPATWTGSLVTALGENAPTTAAGCFLLNMCSGSSWMCPAVPNRNPVGSGNGNGNGNGGTTAPALPSDTLLFLQSLGRALNLGWSGTDYCAFDGVTCAMDATGSVELAEVVLSGRGVRTNALPAVPNSINGARVFVSRIDLSNNAEVRGTFPESWAALKQLQYLDLSDTSLRGSIPDSWNGMTSLEEVRIRNTLACRSLPNWRGTSLARLRVLDLSGNTNLRGVLTNSLGTVTSLTTVDLSGTSLCGCVPATWYRNDALFEAARAAGVPTTNCFANACTSVNFMCPSTAVARPPAPSEDPTLRLLRRIAAALSRLLGNRRSVSGVSRALLPPGQTLEQNWTGDDYCNSWAGVTCDLESGDITLNLTSAGLSGELPPLDNIEGEGVALVSIDFSENPDITGTFPATWGDLKSVRTLRLNNLGIASSLPQEWEGMTALEDLTVSNTAACGTLPAWSANGLPSLRALDLSNNRLSGELPAALGDFANSPLENFTLAGNGGLCGCAPESWVSAALLSGATSANPQLTSAVCAENAVQCTSQPTCRAATTNGGSGDGAAQAASTLFAWAFAALVALAML